MQDFSNAPCLRYERRPEWVPTEYLDHVDNVDQYTTTEMLGMLQGDLSGAAAAWRAVMVIETIIDRLLNRLEVELLDDLTGERFFTTFDVPQITVTEHPHASSSTFDTLFARLLQAATNDHAEHLVEKRMLGASNFEEGERRVFFMMHEWIAHHAEQAYVPLPRGGTSDQYRDFFQVNRSHTRYDPVKIEHKYMLQRDPAMFLPADVPLEDVKDRTVKAPRYEQVARYLQQRWYIPNYRTTYRANTIPVHALLYDIGVLEPYFAQLLQRLYQSAQEHNNAIMVHSWWVNAVLTSLLLDATQAIEQEHDISDMPIPWLKSLVVAHMPSAEEFVDLIYGAEGFLYKAS